MTWILVEVLLRSILLISALEPLVVGSQRLEDLPDDLVALVVAQRLFGRHRPRDADRQDDVAEVLALELAHHPADGLDDVDDDLRGLRNITASRAGTSTPSDRHLAFDRTRHTPLPGRFLEPGDRLLADLDVDRAVDVLGLDLHGVAVAALLERGGDHVREGVGEPLRLLDRRGERDRPPHRLLVAGVLELRPPLGQAVPAADDPCDVVERQFAAVPR